MAPNLREEFAGTLAMTKNDEYSGLMALTLRRIRETARAAGLVWVLLFAVLALPLAQP
jgi:hypothetical protein